MRENLVIGIVGAGGDGVITIGEMILAVARMKGYYGRLNKYYGAQLRGGGSAVKVSLLPDQNKFPEDYLDIFACLSYEKFLEFREELPLSKNTALFAEDDDEKHIFGGQHFTQISFGEISRQTTGNNQNKNIVVFGLFLGLLGFTDPETISWAIKAAKIISRQNLPALKSGLNEAKKTTSEILLPESALNAGSKASIISGNQAISRGIIAAGCKFAATYPITPASDIGENLSHELPKTGGTFIQAEDEIAAICMVLGASLAGAKAVTATSGPGFDLITETINLASSAEVPLVIIDVQRAGPSTGMATKTEQADLSAAIFSGHGYAPRVVLAPYNLEGCYKLTIEAFNIAEEYQVPVILLSDQYLGQTIQIAEDFTVKDCPRKSRILPVANGGRYLRYKITGDFLSPIAIPGMEGFTWRATGLTHDEKGNPAESLEWQKKMQEKITKKLDSLRDRRDLVKISGPANSKVGLISWGSSAEASLAAIKKLGLEKKIRVCMPELMSPMPTEIMREFLLGLRKLFIVEMNYSGQYHGFLRRYFNLPKKTFLCKRPGGRPWSQREIADFIREAG